jgi:hypothetical protein
VITITAIELESAFNQNTIWHREYALRGRAVVVAEVRFSETSDGESMSAEKGVKEDAQFGKEGAFSL